MFACYSRCATTIPRGIASSFQRRATTCTLFTRTHSWNNVPVRSLYYYHHRNPISSSSCRRNVIEDMMARFKPCSNTLITTRKFTNLTRQHPGVIIIPVFDHQHLIPTLHHTITSNQRHLSTTTSTSPLFKSYQSTLSSIAAYIIVGAALLATGFILMKLRSSRKALFVGIVVLIGTFVALGASSIQICLAVLLMAAGFQFSTKLEEDEKLAMVPLLQEAEKQFNAPPNMEQRKQITGQYNTVVLTNNINKYETRQLDYRTVQVTKLATLFDGENPYALPVQREAVIVARRESWLPYAGGKLRFETIELMPK